VTSSAFADTFISISRSRGLANERMPIVLSVTIAKLDRG